MSSFYPFAYVTYDKGGRNPAKRIERLPEQERERFLQPDEFPAFYDAVQHLRHRAARNYFLLLLWTGAWQESVLAMRWDRIDLQARVWRLSSSDEKNNGDSTVYRSDEAVKILTEREAVQRILPALYTLSATLICRHEATVGQSSGAVAATRRPTCRKQLLLTRCAFLRDRTRLRLGVKALAAARLSAFGPCSHIAPACPLGSERVLRPWTTACRRSQTCGPGIHVTAKSDFDAGLPPEAIDLGERR